MKNFLSLIAAGVIGGFMVFTLMNGTNKSNITPIGQPLVQQVGFNSGGPFDFSDAAEKATKCVVHIQAGESESLAQQRRNEQKQNNPFGDLFDNDMFFGSPFGQPRKKQGTGSGVIISSDGYIVTNNHVVGFADDIMITLSNDKTYKGKVIGTDPNSDLAVVKIEADNLPTLDYANSDLAKVGEWVLAVGNPFDYLTSTVTAGIISAKGRDINIIKEYKAIEEFIQTDAAINPGNSGGALVDAQGKLLGINTAIASRTGYYNGYSFAIPVNLMTKIVDDIIEFGSYQRANLGVYINDLDEQYMKDLQLDSKDGVVITELIDGGAAQFAGLRTNDVIVGLNGKAVRSSKELVEGISLSRIDDVLDLDIIRDRRKKKVPVRLRKGL